jgi:hypothetical protein
MHESHRPRPPRVRGAALAVLLLILLPPASAGWAQEPSSAPDPVAELRAEIAKLRADYDRRIADLEAELQALEATQAAAPAPAPAPAPTTGGNQQLNTYFNPSISVIGNYLAVGGHNPVENLPNSNLRESEIGFQAIVDPYARADVFLSYGEEGVDVEEGFVTFTALPAQLLAKVGRMRMNFGKVNSLHLHVLPWPDEPLTVVNLLGGDEGWIGTGVSLGRLFPIGDTFTELTVQAVRADTPDLFESDRRGGLVYSGRYRLFGDLTDASNLEVGLSWADGPNGTTPSARTTLTGLDFTYRWKPLRTATYRGLIVRGEAVRSERAQPSAIGPDVSAFGWFLSGEYRLARRWWLGARLESSERGLDASLRDDGAALLVTFSPSEFSQLRTELRRRRYAENVTANEILFQLQFIIGAHGAHPF